MLWVMCALRQRQTVAGQANQEGGTKLWIQAAAASSQHAALFCDAPCSPLLTTRAPSCLHSPCPADPLN